VIRPGFLVSSSVCWRDKKGFGLKMDETVGHLGEMALFHHTALRASTSKEKRKRLNNSYVKKMRKGLWERCIANVRFI